MISNRQQLNAWMNERRELGHDLVAIKGEPPKGMTYSDGEPVTRPVNIAWKDVVTGEVFAIERDAPKEEA